MTEIDLTSMTAEELEDMHQRVSNERANRQCPEFLPGHPGCDRGRAPHEDHGYDHWSPNGRKIRVTWRHV